MDASVFNDSGVEGILRRTVQVNDLLLDASHAVKNRGRKWLVSGNSLLKIVNGGDLRKKVHLCVCGPENNNFIAFRFLLLNVFSKFIDNFLVGTMENIVGSITLVSSNEIRVESSLHRLNSLKILLKLFDESRLKNVSSLAGIIDTLFTNIPTRDDQINWINHGQKILDRLVDIIKLSISFVVLESSVAGSTLCEGTKHVGLNLTVFGVPSDLLLVGNDTSSES